MPELQVALSSGSDKGARAFASIIPTSPVLRLGGTEVRDTFRLMFALPWAIASWVYQCVCGALVAHDDIRGHHCLTCDGAGEWLRSHNVLRDIWIRIFREAGLTASGDTRQWGCLSTPVATKGQADILVPEWIDGRLLLCDIRRTHPFQQDPAAASLAAASPGGWVCRVEKNKLKRLEQLADEAVALGLPAEIRHSVYLAPLIVDSYGCWGPAAHTLLRGCASRIPAARRSATVNRWRAMLNVGAFRETSRLLRTRAGASLGPGPLGPAPPPSYWGDDLSSLDWRGHHPLLEEEEEDAA